MSEKGGKRSSLLSKAGKSALKSPASGKNDTSAKSKKGRKVQFSSEGSVEPELKYSSKFGKKVDFSAGKDGLSKNSKGEKTAKSEKTSVSAAKERAPLELKLEKEVPENVSCLMDCETAEILGGIHEMMIFLSEDPAYKIPLSFNKALQYAKTGSHYTNPQSVKEVLEPLKMYGASDEEICLIAKICPESAEEVFALILSMKAKRGKLEEPLKDAISKLAKLKRPV